MTPKHNAGQLVASRYELKQIIGKGGFAEVWLAEDTKTSGREVALKLLLDSGDLRSDMPQRFQREAELLSELEHPGIAKALSFGLGFIVLEYVEGITLLDYLTEVASEQREAPTEHRVEIIRQTCEAVGHAHSRGVVHRDLKPSNVMLARGDGPSIRVLDFGVAKILGQDSDQETTRGRVLGTRNYLSPEQLTARDIDARSDVFSLGVLLFETFALKRAWLVDEQGDRLGFTERRKPTGRNGLYDVTERIIRGERPSLRRYRPDLPPALDDVLARALAERPEDRYPTAEVLAGALDSIFMPETELDFDARPAVQVATDDSIPPLPTRNDRLPSDWGTSKTTIPAAPPGSDD